MAIYHSAIRSVTCISPSIASVVTGIIVFTVCYLLKQGVIIHSGNTQQKDTTVSLDWCPTSSPNGKNVYFEKYDNEKCLLIACFLADCQTTTSYPLLSTHILPSIMV